MTKNNGIRYCKTCGSKLIKRGLTSSGKQRWHCYKCNTTRIIQRNDVADRNTIEGINSFLAGKKTMTEIASSKHISRSTVSRVVNKYIKDNPLITPAPTGEVYDYIAIDAIWLAGAAVAIARGPKYVYQWVYGPQEDVYLWRSLFRKIPKPGAIVCDGQKGMLQAIREAYGEDVVIQRCQFHILQAVKHNLSKLIATEAGRKLWSLTKAIFYVKTIEDVNRFNRRYYHIYEDYKDVIDAYSMRQNKAGVVYKRYTNTRLHYVSEMFRELIEKDQLFAHITHPELHLPNTTNIVEGGINSRISELERAHRGLSLIGQQALINNFLWTKTDHFWTQKSTHFAT